MRKLFTFLLALMPLFMAAQKTITLPFYYDEGKETLPEGVIGVSLADNYPYSPHVKFDKNGASLTFHLPNHKGLMFWFDRRKSNTAHDSFLQVKTSTDSKKFTTVARTAVSDRTAGGHSITRYAVSIPTGVHAIKLYFEKPKNNRGVMGFGAFHIAEAVPVTITDAKYATFMAGSNVYLPPTVKACIVEAKGNGIKVKELVDQVVNANVPVLLQGEAGTYAAEPDVTATGSNTFAGNLLKGSLTTTTITAPVGHKLYVLNKGSKGVGFYWEMGTAGNSVNLQAGHAYLSLPISGGAAQGFSLDTPTVTGVEAVETIPSEDAHIYDLSGRRVTTPTHGIYIVGGKKVLK